MTGISLYKLIADEFRNHLFVNTVSMMRTISHQIEDVIIEHALPVDIYAGFQTYSAFLRQQARYERLAAVARRVFVMGIPDVPLPKIPGIEFVPLSPDASLAKEWFLVINTPYFYTALLTRETGGEDPMAQGRRFEGLWTHDERTVGQAYLILAQFLGQEYRPVTQRDYRRQNDYVVAISTNLVTRLERSNIVRSRTKRLATALSNVAQAVSADQPSDTLMDGIVSDLRQSFKARTVALWQATGDGEMELQAAAGFPANWRRAAYRRQPMEESDIPAANVLRTHAARIVADTEQSGEADPFDPAVRSIVAVPLQARGKLVGALQMTDHRPNTYDDESLQVLQTIGGQIALALQGSPLSQAAAPVAAPRERELDQTWAVLDSTLDGVIVLNADRTLRFVNNAAAHLMGVEDRRLAGKPISVFGRPELTALVGELVAQSASIYRELTSSQGRKLLLGISPTYLEDDPTQVSSWTMVIRDLADALGQGNSLAPVADDLMARLEAVSNLVTMLPTLGELSAPQNQAVTQINRLTEEMGMMVGQLVKLDQIQEGTTQRQPVHVRPVAQGVVNALQEAARVKNIELSNELSDELPEIPANPDLLMEAITALVDNAVKYSPSGARVRLLAKADEEFITLAVRDTGMGIWLKDMPFLFDRFFRVRSPQVLAIPGHGLGLALVKAVATSHGGHAWAESRVGRGSTFFIRLPRESQE